MSAAILSSQGAPDARAYAALERRLQALRGSAFGSSPDAALREFTELRGQIDDYIAALKRRLLAPSLTARQSDKASFRWISTQHRRLARVARRMAESLARQAGTDDRTLRLAALGLHYMGESVKGDAKDPLHYAGLHALMRIAVSSGRHREPMQLDFGGRPASCTLASLYFRALLLSRLAGGDLTFPQIEILDAWMWIWMPALAGVDTAPEGAAWRADLDSNVGLRHGARADAGPSLYLPQAPLDAALHAIVQEFHAGRTVPASADVSKLAIADHIAVLDAVRRGLRRARRGPIPRAPRHGANDVVELHVGLAEVMTNGFALTGSSAPSIAFLQAIDGGAGAPRKERERDNAMGEIYDAARRMVQLINVSDTGVGLEGEEADCSEVAVGDLVALRLAPGEPLLLARVVRRPPVVTGGRVVIGMCRVSPAAQLVRAFRPSARPLSRELSMLYIPGRDEGGRRDAYLTSDASLTERTPLETTAGDDTFTFRFDRVRERGRGWVMAGFEIIAARRPERGASVTPPPRPGSVIPPSTH